MGPLVSGAEAATTADAELLQLQAAVNADVELLHQQARSHAWIAFAAAACRSGGSAPAMAAIADTLLIEWEKRFAGPA